MPKVHLVDQLYDSNAKHTVHCAGVKKRKSSTCSGDDWSCSLERRCDQFLDDFSSRSPRTRSSSSSGKLNIIIHHPQDKILVSRSDNLPGPGSPGWLNLSHFPHLLQGDLDHVAQDENCVRDLQDDDEDDPENEVDSVVVQLIPTMTNSHPGRFLSLMLLVGMCCKEISDILRL